MTSTVTVRGQTAIPAAIRNRYKIKPRMRIEWIDDGHSISIVPVSENPIKELRGKFKNHGLSKALLKMRTEERKHE